MKLKHYTRVILLVFLVLSVLMFSPLQNLWLLQIVKASPDSNTWQVGADTDDAHYRPIDDDFGTGYYFLLGADTSHTYQSCARFINIGISQGSTINSAYLKVKAASTKTVSPVHSKIEGEDANDTITFSTREDYLARPRTTASVEWHDISGWTAEVEYTSPDIASVIQEIVNRAGWVSGNSLVIFWDNDGTTLGSKKNRIAYSHDTDTSKAPKLEITFQVGIQEYERSASQAVNLEATSSRQLSLGKTVESTVSLGSVLSSLLSFGRSMDAEADLLVEPSRSLSLAREKSASLGLSSTLSEMLGIGRETDSTLLADVALSSTLSLQRIPSIILSLSTVLSRTVTMQRPIEAKSVLAASLSKILSLQRLSETSLTLSSALSSTLKLQRAFDGSLSLADDLVRSLSLQRITEQDLTLSSMPATTKTLQRTLLSSISLQSILSKVLGTQRGIDQPFSLEALLSETLAFQREGSQPFSLNALTTKLLALQRTAQADLTLSGIVEALTGTEANLQAALDLLSSLDTVKAFSRNPFEAISLGTLLSRRLTLTKTVTTLLNLKASLARQSSYQKALRQLLSLLTEADKTVLFSRLLEQPFNLQSALAKIVAYTKTLQQYISLSTLLEAELPTNIFNLQATLSLKAEVQRQITVSFRLSEILRLLTSLVGQVTTPTIGSHVHIHIPNIISAHLHPIEPSIPKLTDVWDRSVPITAKITLENHLDHIETVTVIWWVTKFRSKEVLVNETRYVDLDLMNPEVTAMIQFDLPVDAELIPRLDETYAFHAQIEYSLGERTERTSQLITLFTLSDAVVHQHLIYLAIIIIAMAIITVLVYFQRQKRAVEDAET